MAVAKLEYEIGADLSKFDLSITELNALIKKFTAEASSASKDGLAPLNAEIAKLIQYRQKLKSVGLPTDLPDNAKRSTIALNDLNRVVQDLPFGFIGIQNNIPALFQSFSKLTADSNGVKNAFKEIGSAIAGPTGILLGISVLTSTLTGLVQSYGSLGNAFKSIFGIQKDAIDLQNQYNVSLEKSVQSSAGEIVNLQSFVNILTNTNSTLNERNGAYEILNKLAPGILLNISKENKLTQEQTKLVGDRLKLFITEIELKGKSQTLQDLIGKSAKESYETLNKITTGGVYEKAGLLFQGLIQGGLQGSNAINVIGNTFAKSGKETKFYSKLLTDVNTQLAGVTSQINKLTGEEKNQKLSQKAAEKAAKEKLKIESKNAEELLKIQQDLFDREDTAFKISQDAYISTLTDREKELYKVQDEYEQQRIGLLRSNIEDFAGIEEEKLIKIRAIVEKYDAIALKDREKLKNERLKIDKEESAAVQKLFENTANSFQPKINIDFTKLGLNKNYVKELLKGFSAEDATKNIQESFIKTGKVIFDNVINPLTELFDVVLKKGEKSWADFSASIIESLKKLIIKLAAAAAIAVILSVISGGSSNAAKGGVSFGKAFGSLLGFSGGKSVANPSFGGVQPAAGMAMNGNVNLVLRGQDLVGSLNRTNSQLSRIG